MSSSVVLDTPCRVKEKGDLNILDLLTLGVLFNAECYRDPTLISD